MTETNPDELLQLALRVAKDAGEALLGHYNGPLSGVQTKSTQTDLVSDADRDAERIILDAIRAARPDDAILSEEGGGAEGISGIEWRVDPLDGTTNFLWRVPHWAVSIAAFDTAGALVGVVADPNRREIFSATRGGGASDGASAIRVRQESELSQALIGTGFNYSATERAKQAERLTRTVHRVRDLRRFGAAALDLAWVAAGRLDGFFETGLEPWDWAAGALLIQEAGGSVEVIPERDGSPHCVVGASRSLMPKLITLVSEAYR